MNPQTPQDSSGIEEIFNTAYMKGFIDSSALSWFQHGEGKVLLEAYTRQQRIDELDNLPWKRADKYGINTPYVTKEWLVNRKAELMREPRIVGVTMPDGQVVRLHQSAALQSQEGAA